MADIATLKDQMRADFFSSEKNKPLKEVVEFRGHKIEIRQPTLGSVLAAQEGGSRANTVAQTLIQYAYIPDTDERIFDDADIDGLLQMPFGADFVRVSEALSRMTTVNFPEPKGDSGEKASDT